MDERSKPNDTATEMMTHQEAAQSGAVERYLLDDMTPGERSRFEEHYFICPVCAEEVATGQDFIEGVRELHSKSDPNRAKTPLPKSKAPWWKRIFTVPILIPAMLILLAVDVRNIFSIGALKSQIAALSAPQAATLITAHEEEERGALSTVNTQAVIVRFPLPDGPAYPFYRIDVAHGDKLALSKVIPSPPSENGLVLTLNKQLIGAGHFDVTVFGLGQAQSKDGATVGHYKFGIR
ncbi:MAG: zf-HC2 domain-containing protein [Acidobacteriaceae bacterium]|nr:zf-HC2 domain-containing protein [Acidobacteriaceae bacterium]